MFDSGKNGWYVNLAGLADMRKDCGWVDSPADDPIQPAEDSHYGYVTEGYMNKLMETCAR